MTRRPLPSRRASRAFATAGVLGAALLLSGCSELSQQTTKLHYDASDGVSGTVGSLQLSNVLVVAPGQSKPGAFQGLVTNQGDAPIKLSINAGGTKLPELTVPAMTSVRLDGQANGNDTAKAAAVKLPSVPVKPGHNVKVTFGAPSVGEVPLDVPVLLDQEPYGSASVTHAPDEQPTEGGDVGLADPGNH